MNKDPKAHFTQNTKIIHGYIFLLQLLYLQQSVFLWTVFRTGFWIKLYATMTGFVLLYLTLLMHLHTSLCTLSYLKISWLARLYFTGHLQYKKESFWGPTDITSLAGFVWDGTNVRNVTKVKKEQLYKAIFYFAKMKRKDIRPFILAISLSNPLHIEIFPTTSISLALHLVSCQRLIN